VLPPGPRVAELAHEARRVPGDKVKVAELVCCSLLHLIQRTKHRYRMHVELQRPLPAPPHIGNLTLVDRGVFLELILQWRWPGAHDVGFPHSLLEVRGYQVGVEAVSLSGRLHPVTFRTERLEALLAEALGEALDVIPLERGASSVKQSAAVVVLLQKLRLRVGSYRALLREPRQAALPAPVPRVSQDQDGF